MNEEPVTLDTCAREPIHIPGAIQPHGVLFSVRGPELRVQQVSENVAITLGVAVDAVLGAPLGTLFDEASAAFLLRLLDYPLLRDVSPARVVTTSGLVFDAVLHRPSDARDFLVVELEPALGDRPSEGAAFDPRLRSVVVRMGGTTTVQELCDLAATCVREITGFDRVMVYRFDPDWNGEVVSEAKRDDLEPFLGQHYPASDIPAQARRLYTVNWLRFIGDADYAPVRLVPALDPVSSAPLDMSHCVLRSVSPIHVEYMKNMGVRASMSISLVDDGKLIGLIACHHYGGAKIVPFHLRETAEFLGRTLSWHVRVLERADEAHLARGAQAHEAEVVRALAINPDLLESLLGPAFVALTGADGGAVVLAEGTRTTGLTPRDSHIAALVEWLASSTTGDVYTTDALAETFPEAGAELPGVVAVALSRELGEWILWFRKPTERTIDWAGDPRKVVVPAEGERPERLSPRGSFALWRETVKGKSLPWQSWQVEAASSLRRVLVGGLRQRAKKLRELNERLVANDRARDEFIATVSHELRNPLSAITGWTRLLREGNLSPDRRAHAVEVISRNAAAQSQLIEDLLDVSRMTSGKLSLEVDSVDMVELVEAAVESVKLALESKDIRLKRILDTRATPVVGDALRLRQVVTNLLNNAVKFTPKNGSITVLLQRIDSDIELVVSDTGQGISPDFLPHMFELFRQEDAGMNRRSQGLGLGLTLVKRLVELHGGRVVAKSEGLGKGASFHVRLPMSAVRVTPVSAVEPPALPEASATTARAGLDLNGLSILVVEDEPDARDLLTHVLESYGARVTSAPNAVDGLSLLARTTFDVIVSDVGMPEMDGFQFMRELRGRDAARGGKTPAIALTAYTRTMDRTTALIAGFQAHVPKPVDATELVAVVSSLAARFVTR